METLLTTSPSEAAAFVRRGDVVAFPTETVYGLGADAFDVEAVARIFQAKARPADNPLIVHVATADAVPRLAARVPTDARRLLEAFFPGPLTLVLPRHRNVPSAVAAGLDTIGVRMPRHPVALAFLAACGRPVAAPSANRSGRPSPTTWQAVEADLGGRIPCILQGDRSPVGLESTVVDCSEAEPVVLRAGAVTLEMLRSVVPSVRLAEPGGEALARSPGTRHRHYAPRARVVLVDGPDDVTAAPETAYIGLAPPPAPERFGRALVCTDVDGYAHALFDFFRRCDAEGLRVIACQRVEPAGVGLALMDRLRRAAE